MFLKLPGPVDRPLLPCLPPASTLQVDVNGDGERPPGRSRVQEHAHNYLCLRHLPAPSMYIHLTSSSVSESQMSFCQQLIISCLQQAPVKRGDWLSGPDCSLFTGGLPVVYQGSKVSATTPSSLMCVSIETTTGKAGRMLMGLSVGLWGSDVTVCRGKAEWIPSSLWTFYTEWNSMMTVQEKLGSYAKLTIFSHTLPLLN